MLTLSKHFVENWQKRVVDIAPTAGAVLGVIRDSVRVQAGKELMLDDGTSFTVLSLFWHPELEIIISLDPVRSTMVSVLSKENWRNDHDKKND